MNRRTIVFSRILDKTDVIETGLKFDWVMVLVTFRIGLIMTACHWDGTNKCWQKRVKMWAVAYM